jgi:hypothetical protein
MEYFKRSNREKEDGDNKLVGISVPTSIVDYLNLFCVADSCSKTSIIRPLVERWVRKAKVKFPEEKLIETIAQNGYKGHNKRKSFVTIIKAIKRELQRRGIKESNIDEIIKQIIHAKGKED